MKSGLRNVVVSLLTWEARLSLFIHRPNIVAVTGNIGKTTTKDAIFAVVSGHFRARKSQKSFNSDIGVPLTILDLDNPWSNPFKWLWTLAAGLVAALLPGYPKLLVLEVGADKPGDISPIAKWLKPNIAVYTGVPEIPVHIGYFASREELVQEKRSLLQHIRPGGIAVVNGDFDVMEATSGVSAKIITYGTQPSLDVSASAIAIAVGEHGFPKGMNAKVSANGSSLDIVMHGALGKPIVVSALAAFAVGEALGIARNSIVRAIGAWQPTPSRMRVLRGVNGSVIIDDTYNSSPAAALSALETLKQVSAKRKIAVLGDMRELGGMSAEGHRQVGMFVSSVADSLITVGEESKVLAQAAREAGMTEVREYGYDSSSQVGKELALGTRAGDAILVKGSQNHIRLERCVYELLADRSGAEKLLVRFDRTWRKRA